MTQHSLLFLIILSCTEGNSHPDCQDVPFVHVIVSENRTVISCTSILKLRIQLENQNFKIIIFLYPFVRTDNSIIQQMGSLLIGLSC